MQNLGPHSKISEKWVQECMQRYQRSVQRARRTKVTVQISANEASSDESMTTVDEFETRKESSEDVIASLRMELNAAYTTITHLKQDLERLQPFTESSVQSKAMPCMSNTILVFQISKFSK